MSDGQSLPAGWYPDPNNPSQQRWWNGAEWTNQYAPMTPTARTDLPLTKRGNPVGVTGFVFAILGIILACIPPLMGFGWLMLVAAFVLGIVGTALPNRAKWSGITALSLSVVGTFIGFIAFFSLIGSSFNSNLPTPQAGSNSETDSSSPEEASNEIPAGFEDTGAGVAIKWVDNPQCDFGVCSQVEVLALKDCRNSLYLEANVLNSSGTIVGYTNDLLSSVSKGQKALMTLNVTNDSGVRVELTDISCY